MIPKDEWEWFGKAGHFICGEWCRFHLCTRIGNYLVSTIGEYVHPRHSQGSEITESSWLAKNFPGENIGYKRKYETMVFKFAGMCNRPNCNCGQPMIEGKELETNRYNHRTEATRGHMEICEKLAKEKQ